MAFELLSTFAGDLFDGLDYDVAIDNAVKLHDSEIEDLNIAQLRKGEKSDDTNTGEYKSLEYKGRLTPVDLNKDGGFYQGINAKSKGGLLTLDSTDEKTGKLQDKYGDAILGLTESNMQEAASIILEDVGDNLIKQIIS